MTDKEMSEIFSVLLMAYPNAECFKGGKEKLLPTIKLWTSSCSDIDFWTAQKAVNQMISSNKFFPAISEFKDAAKAITDEIELRSECLYLQIRNAYDLFPPKTAYSRLSPDGKRVVDAMGGLQGITTTDGKAYRYSDIKKAFLSMIKFPALPGEKRRLT